MTAEHTLVLDGKDVSFREGETLLEVARRVGINIPTLCHDPRLEPAGACRTCLVEVEGQRRLVPSCATPATPGMTVTTRNPRIERHLATLLALYLTDHPKSIQDCEDGPSCDLHRMAERHQAPSHWPQLVSRRKDRSEDENPYIQYRQDRCILCARCTRYCEEVEGVSAITLAGRGSDTHITTVDGHSLLDTSCELCGGCIDVCPTGALSEKMPLVAGAKPDRGLEKIRTTCNYCGVGCQMDLNVDREALEGRGKVVKVTSPPPASTTNDGNLCVKGRFAYDFIDHPDRLTVPLIRGKDGTLHEASWREALEAAANGLLQVKARHGADALSFISSSRCTGEENYLVQKLARAAFGTNNVHQCAAT